MIRSNHKKIPLKMNKLNCCPALFTAHKQTETWRVVKHVHYEAASKPPLWWVHLRQPQLSRRRSTEPVFRSAGSPQRAFTSLRGVLWKTSSCLWVTEKHTDSPEGCMHGTTFPVGELTAARKALSMWSSLISSSWPLVAAICSWTMSSQSETD